MCGLVLDITKCFNVLDRRLVAQVMIRAGCPASLVQAWIAALNQLSRHVMVTGFSFGDSPSSTGVPEGDPLSVCAMFCVSWACSHFVVSQCNGILPACYADNWQFLARTTATLKSAGPFIEAFLDKACLPISAPKCWVWSTSVPGRKRLRTFQLFGTSIPLRYQAKDLGADISYCRRKAAKVRNARVLTGTRRFHRLAGLPTSRGHKTHLLLAGIFPHVLHGAETSVVPRTVLQRLRSFTTLALNLRRKGASPWLSCLLGTHVCVDPEFVLLINRVRLYRQVTRELPNLSRHFQEELTSGGRCRGPTRLLVSALHSLGWVHQGRGVFEDDFGRVFQLTLTPLQHIVALLQSTWADLVTRQVSHRKYLHDLVSIDGRFDLCVTLAALRTRFACSPKNRGVFLR